MTQESERYTGVVIIMTLVLNAANLKSIPGSVYGPQSTVIPEHRARKKPGVQLHLFKNQRLKISKENITEKLTNIVIDFNL